MITVAEIKIDGLDYVAFWNGQEITRQKTLAKASQKLAKYIKGQS